MYIFYYQFYIKLPGIHPQFPCSRKNFQDQLDFLQLSCYNQILQYHFLLL